MSKAFDLNKFTTAEGRKRGSCFSKKVTPDENNSKHFGCPLDWVKRVEPLMKTKKQLLVAIWLYRQKSVRKAKGAVWFDATSKALWEDLKISRKVKLATFKRLTSAGAIEVVQDGKKATQVRILWS